ncbi:hypothetical protein SK128_002378 [Halocaridina rubra]|uniref:Uncharacterized protein n=1 Tax=Halocaridina rubra TaxID=373956 RepID=A0AAN8XNQ4_HALRR
MTAHDNNQIPLLTKISRKKLRRQKAEEGNQTFATDGNVAVNGNKERRVTYSRSDSVKERYDRVGGANNIRIYNHELLQAAEDKNYDKCKDLLEKGANVNIADEETECTALHIACKNDSYDILRLFLAKGANCNAQDKTEQTPLHLAVRKDHRLCCQILLDCQDLQINLYNKTYDTPLHVAAKEGRYEISKLILQHKEAKVNAKNKKGMNSLHYAAQESQVSILKLLLDNNANWKQQDNQSYLPLHYAAQKGYPECCSTLIANVDEDNQNKALSICTRDGKTPLMLAAKGGHHRCCEVMQYGNINAKDKDGNTALHYAAQGGFDFTVIELLNAGADPNTQNKKGCSPMLEAAGKKKFGCLKILAEKGENLNVSDKQKKNVLHYAAERNALEALRFLLKYQVLKNIIDAEDRSYYTPLHLAIKRDADECALLLLEHGASPVKKSASGMTPLHLAADKGSISVCEVLLSRKDVQVSQENDAKATPLHMAALRGSVDVCQMLIRKGARITAVDDKGRTALHVASAEGHEKAVKFLSKRGISLRAKDDTGSSALHLAAFKGSLPCCKILVDCAKAACWEVDQNNDLPLDKAFKELDDKLAQSSLSDHDHVFKFLLENLCFKEHHEGRMLRIHKYMDTALNDRRS